MPSSPIRKLVPFAEAAKQLDIHVHHLNIGQPDLETPKQFWEKLHQLNGPVLAYCPSEGYPSYREAIAKYYRGLGIEVQASDFIVTTGASEALFFALFSCLDAGNEVIIPEPLYANYIGFASAGNIKIKPISTDIRTGFALPPIDEFERSITTATKGILVCNPNNPTGYLYNDDELQRLKEIVKRHNLFLFVDEVYREFAYDGRKHRSILTFDGLDEHVVVIDSISKRFSACGARLGAVVTRNQTIYDTVMKFAQARLSPPSISQLAGDTLFDLGEEYYSAVRHEYRDRRDYLVNALNEIDGVYCPNPGGAFYAMVELPIEDSDHFAQWLLEEFSHESETVMLAPGSGFYATPGSGKNQARVAYVLNQSDLSRAINCLREGLKVYSAMQGKSLNEVDSVSG